MFKDKKGGDLLKMIEKKISIYEKNDKKNITIESIIPVLALRGMVMFPNMALYFDIGRRKSVLALEESMRQGQVIFITAQKDVRDDVPEPNGVFDFGVKAKVKQIVHQPGGMARALVEGMYRAQVVEFISKKPFMRARITVPEEIQGSDSVPREAMERRARGLFLEYINLCPTVPAETIIGLHSIKETGQLADFIAANVSFGFEEKQSLLEELSVDLRMEKLAVLLARELEVLKIENNLALKLKDTVDKQQKEYFLREQMKIISEELGEEDEKSVAADYRKKLKRLKLSKDNTKKLLEKIEKFEKLPPISSESGILRSYLDFCFSLPWNKLFKENYDLVNAERILENEHYGLKDVKERIVEFLASGKLSQGANGSQIMCLNGPPGVGKTSVAKSLAKALGRKFVRISLGGINDEAEIRGHRKTYVGAMAGRIIDSIKRAGIRNPMILLDEIDKLTKNSLGDPSAALLEALDPEQNKAFVDHYVDLEFDLSKVFFITTSNDKSKIPEPLRDRLEIIDLYSYTHEEKFNIAKKHLICKQMKKNGLNSKKFTITDEALRILIDNYTREAGVRELERKIASLMRKTAKKILIENIKKISINKENLEKMLGPKKYKKEDDEISEVGVVRGLAWTSVGGETMPIEVSLMKGKGKVQITGSLGEVMKESAKLAVSYIRSNSQELGIDNNFYEHYDIHIHAPEGATPKDGPSAGITMTTALVSALSGFPARQNVAMTGEITLKGKVLPIGGLREKTMAAYRAGVKTVIIPSGNESDLAEIDPMVKNSINFITANNLKTVFKNALIKE
jgi:ATP-dependent Lon protease